MKALVTGSEGFVGRHLTTELNANGYRVHGMDITCGEKLCRDGRPYVDAFSCIDLLEKPALLEHVQDIKPKIIFHLAAQSNVVTSWKKPQQTYGVNVLGTLNLLDAVNQLENPCRIVLVGSADQYGVAGLSEKPISEDVAQNPKNPYAASKKAQEEIAEVYANAYSMDIVYMRPFNHSGPGQGLGFLIPDVCHGIVQVEKGESEYLKVGNLEAVRDFSDVRDVVRSYRLVGEKGYGGEVYNVGSGVGRKAQEILDMLLEMSECEILVRQDESRMRKSDTPILVCDNTKLKNHTGWDAEVSIEKTLRDTLEYYRKNI